MGALHRRRLEDPQPGLAGLRASGGRVRADRPSPPGPGRREVPRGGPSGGGQRGLGRLLPERPRAAHGRARRRGRGRTRAAPGPPARREGPGAQCAVGETEVPRARSRRRVGGWAVPSWRDGAGLAATWCPHRPSPCGQTLPCGCPGSRSAPASPKAQPGAEGGCAAPLWGAGLARPLTRPPPGPLRAQLPGPPAPQAPSCAAPCAPALPGLPCRHQPPREGPREPP